MKKTILILLVIALAVFLVGCGPTEETTSTKFIGGTSGIVASFVEGAPPELVHTGGEEPFTVTIRLENEGEEAIIKEDMVVQLKGFDPTDFGTTKEDLFQNPPEDIMKNEITPETGNIIASSPVFVDFDLNYEKDLTGAAHDFPIQADICYKYKTYATAELCIKENILDTTDTEVCEVIGGKVVSNSGSPVHVENVEESTQGANAIAFTFLVKKIGAGELFSPGTSCLDERANEDRVYVEVETGMAGELTCSTLSDGSEGYVKLIDGQKTIRCVQTLPESEKSDKVKIANIHLSYDYQDMISTTLKVVQRTG